MGSLSANPSTAKLVESKPTLKFSGQRIFGGANQSPNHSPGGIGEYKTTNQTFQKWIRPNAKQIQLDWMQSKS